VFDGQMIQTSICSNNKLDTKQTKLEIVLSQLIFFKANLGIDIIKHKET